MSNDDMRRTWADGAAGWVAHEAVFDRAFAPVTAALLADADLAPGQRVLDVGCGTGTLLAAAVAAGADPVGVDIAPGMAAAARRRVPDATVLVGDAQSMALPAPPFDRVVSRFGVMFFADPVAAFAHLAGASRPGARLVFACWRSREENPQFRLGSEVLVAHMDPPPTPQASDAPGPTAYADPDRLRRLLTAGGWDDIGIAPLDVTLDYGTGSSDGVEERVAVVLSLELGRTARAQLEPRLGPDGWAAVVEEVRAAVRTAVVDGRVQIPGATWRVTARRR